MKKILLSLALTIGFSQLYAQCDAYTVSKAKAYRQSHTLHIAPVMVKCDYSNGPVTLKFYHPDAPDNVYTMSVDANEKVQVKFGQEITSIGSDWGVQVVFGNGVKSCISCVGDVATFRDNVFEINLSRVYNLAH